jgi:M6 family metalloprotease-like protein
MSAPAPTPAHPLPTPAHSRVVLRTPTRPQFPGSFYRVPVIIPQQLGLTIDDLDFRVPAGLKGGAVSLSRDALFNPKRPEVMLLLGYKPGKYRLQALKKGTSTVISEGVFEITARWLEDTESPSKWFTGIVPNYTFGPTWGGGSGAGPQNVNTIPAIGTKRVAVLLVDTSDQRYTTDAATLNGFRTKWQQHLLDGFVGPDGVTRSVKGYYNEVSYGNLQIAGQIFGDVVHLPNPWSDYFQTDGNGNWQAKAGFIDQCITAAGDGVNLTGFDMIVCASQAFSSATPNAKIAWPYGGIGVNIDTSHGRVTGRGISMPNSWGDGSAFDQSGGRTIYETLTHEMGHTINLPDEYTPVVGFRNIGNQGTNASWDPMDWEKPWPHLTIAHRMMLGWVQPAWLKTYNFQALGTTVDETTTLHPIELGAPPAGRSSGIEVRIGDGRNYYFEYRSGQLGQIGDENLIPNGRVAGTDVSEPPDPPVISRPDILLLPTHPDDNGPILGNGDLYHEVDSSSPTFPSDFRVDVSGIDGNKADVRIRYGVIGKPDPSIRPWPRSADHQWQSPDIDVSNARSIADPANWANVPWLGHDNTVTAHITNRGTLSAPGVVANFFVKDYTVGGAPETPLGFDRHDVMPGATVDFTATWNPPTPADPATPLHFCIIVRIDPYQTPTNPPITELTDANNVAQSNYDRFISASGSPPSREITAVTVGNPYDRPTRFFIGAGQTNPFYRTYLEHTCVTLDAHQTRQVQVMFEYAPDAELPPKVLKEKERFERMANQVGIWGAIENPHDAQLHQAALVTGAQSTIVTGRATKFRDFAVNADGASGVVVTVDNKPVSGGTVIVILKANGDKVETYEHAKVEQNGFFHARVSPKWHSAEAYYVPPPGFGDTTSKRLTNPKTT